MSELLLESKYLSHWCQTESAIPGLVIVTQEPMLGHRLPVGLILNSSWV